MSGNRSQSPNQARRAVSPERERDETPSSPLARRDTKDASENGNERAKSPIRKRLTGTHDYRTYRCSDVCRCAMFLHFLRAERTCFRQRCQKRTASSSGVCHPSRENGPHQWSVCVLTAKTSSLSTPTGVMRTVLSHIVFFCFDTSAQTWCVSCLLPRWALSTSSV